MVFRMIRKRLNCGLGVVGARQVKWLRTITLSDDESGSHWQQKDYRIFSPGADFNTVEYSSAPAIQDAPVQSAICSPVHRTRIKKGAPHTRTSATLKRRFYFSKCEQ